MMDSISHHKLSQEIAEIKWGSSSFINTDFNFSDGQFISTSIKINVPINNRQPTYEIISSMRTSIFINIDATIIKWIKENGDKKFIDLRKFNPLDPIQGTVKLTTNRRVKEEFFRKALRSIRCKKLITNIRLGDYLTDDLGNFVNDSNHHHSKFGSKNVYMDHYLNWESNVITLFDEINTNMFDFEWSVLYTPKGESEYLHIKFNLKFRVDNPIVAFVFEDGYDNVNISEYYSLIKIVNRNYKIENIISGDNSNPINLTPKFGQDGIFKLSE